MIDPLQRKQLFEVYLIGKREAEYKKVQESRQKYMEQFRLILEKHDIKSYTRWKTCESEISEEKVCMSIPKDLQKQFFRNYVQELKDEERKQRDERRKSQLSRLEEETTAVVKVNSKFEELIKVIDFAKKYPDLNKVDVITIFETTMMKRMDEFKKVVAKSKKKNERADRSQLSHLGTFFVVRGATPGTPVHLVLEFRGEKIRQVTQASIYVHSSATMG